jgi:transposase
MLDSGDVFCYIIIIISISYNQRKQMSSKFIPADRHTPYLFPPSLQDWLPEDHLARFVVDIISQLNLCPLSESYAGRGSKAHHPEVLLPLLFYGYATGIYSSRKIEQATYDSVAFRFIAANTHPDHDTIATFRRRFLDQLQPLFVQILLLAQEIGVLKLGKISLDGTKIKANASKHHALSWQHACKIEQQLQAEVAELMRLAEEADNTEIPDGMRIPEELIRRQDRLQALAEAKEKIKQRAANGTNGKRRNTTQRLPHGRPRLRSPGRSRAVVNQSRRNQALGRRTKSISPMKNPGLCRQPARALSRHTMPRLALMSIPC